MYRETPHPFPGNPDDFAPADFADEHRSLRQAVDLTYVKKDNEERRLMNLRMLRFGASLRALRTADRIKLAGSEYVLNYWSDTRFDL